MENDSQTINVDLTYIDHLANGDQDLKKTLVVSVIEDLPLEMIKLKDCFEEKDVEGYYKVAHKLKTTYAYVGLKENKIVHNALERYKKDGTFEFDTSIFPDLLQIGEDTVMQLRKIYPEVSI